MPVQPSPIAARVARVLKVLASQPSTAFSLSELARQTDMNRASCQTLLLGLTAEGLVRRHEGGPTYQLGPALIQIGEAARDSLDVIELARPDAWLDNDRDSAAVGEFHRIAGEVEQHLTQARGVADHLRGQAVLDITRDLELLRLCARRNQFDGFLDQGGEIEFPGVKIDAAGFDLGEVENLLD